MQCLVPLLHATGEIATLVERCLLVCGVVPSLPHSCFSCSKICVSFISETRSRPPLRRSPILTGTSILRAKFLHKWSSLLPPAYAHCRKPSTLIMHVPEGIVNAETPLLSETKALWTTEKPGSTDESGAVETPVDVFPMRTE